MKTKQGNWIVECENKEQTINVSNYVDKDYDKDWSHCKYVWYNSGEKDFEDEFKYITKRHPNAELISFEEWEKLPNEEIKYMPHTNVVSIEKSNEEKESSPKHYDNSKGSIYQFCDNQKLNSYEFDIIKRVARCRKKGNFREDLEKTKFLIDLYLNETENQ